MKIFENEEVLIMEKLDLKQIGDVASLAAAKVKSCLATN